MEVIMATTVVQFRVEESLKNEATEIFESLGLDLPTAFRMFLKKSVAKRGIPFGVKVENKSSSKFLNAFYGLREEAEKNGVQGMNLDEINGIITEVREKKVC